MSLSYLMDPYEDVNLKNVQPIYHQGSPVTIVWETYDETDEILA